MTSGTQSHPQSPSQPRAENAGNGHAGADDAVLPFAVEALTDLVFIELPEVGRQVAAGDSFGEVESVKAVSDIYCHSNRGT